MRYGTLILAAGAFWSSQASAGEPQSVYVAPGGVYIASAQVYVRPANGDAPYAAPGPSYYAPGYAPAPTYAPGYVSPRPLYRAPAYNGAYGPAYPAPSVYIAPEPGYASAYATDLPPRPPALVPYNNTGRCVIYPAYGPPAYCD